MGMGLQRYSSMIPLPTFLGLLLVTSEESNNPSRWRRRTAKRRERTEQILTGIETSGVLPPPLYDAYRRGNKHLSRSCDGIPTLLNSPIDWDKLDGTIDPIRGGKIRPDTPRGARKRAQVEAFAYVVSELLKNSSKDRHSTVSSAIKGTTIIDAGSGAGNLAIPLAYLLDMETSEDFDNHEIDMLAIDVNEIALQRLAERAASIPTIGGNSAIAKIRTLGADLANADIIMKDIPSDQDVIVVSLHACSAASDYAMNLAYKRDAPFVICPCCTAKSLTKRDDSKNSNSHNTVKASSEDYGMNTSFKRSGATDDITYPRSKWLNNAIMSLDATNNSSKSHRKNEYALLAKVADVGLGPQTPTQQREHQRRSKKIIELDRLASSSENHGYETDLFRIQHHDPREYGKGELLLGAKKGSVAADVFSSLHVKYTE